MTDRPERERVIAHLLSAHGVYVPAETTWEKVVERHTEIHGGEQWK